MRKLPRTPDHPAVRRTDPAYAPTVEMFDAMTHREIHDKVALLKPAVLTGGQQSWGQAAAGLADAVAQAHTEIRAAIADGWRGSGAQNAADAVYAFEQTGQDLADVLAVVSQRLGQAGDAAEALRKAVVAPTASAPDLGAALLDPTQATTNAADQKAAEHSRQDIVRAMNDIYAGVLIPTGNDVPAFLDQQSNGAADAPGSWPASKLTGAGTSVETPAVQQVPDEPAVAARLGAGVAPTAPATTAPDTVTEPVEQRETTTTAGAAAAPASADAPAAAPARAGTVPAGVDAALSTAPAAARVPVPPAAAPSTATTVASAQPVSVPSVPGSAAAAPADDQRKREERRKDSSSDAVTGLGAGAMGGLMGGALAMGDTPRPGTSVAANAASTARAARFDDEDEYEDDFHFDDMPTYLEPSDEGGELIGSIDPTTPPVLGEWTELE
ncbi:PPE domain-containing protein [Nocardia brasiliensis]|uniref:PPE domain-containing protein n=1 Tax=Nocardia brasiliensis (strain ATCC 700358 / HUJEG-1) TaxID=1133849 RepID=K0F5Y7_NOCB7|nr:hypothetical protein [Nocardia brasiliensis]AFU05039.1 hypothetical protein O3I_035460 [Nocardia brasiliensis ATCC 700358]